VTYQDWRRRLQDVVDEGLGELRAAQVIAALSAEVARAGKAPRSAPVRSAPTPAALVVPAPVLGVDASAGGWVGVLLRPEGPLQVMSATTIDGLVELARHAAEVQVVAIDIPIGLPDSGRRQADVLARKALPGKASSVFTTLTRATYLAATYAEARETSVATAGSGAPAQAYRLREKLLQVDDWVRGRPPVRVVEVHPELSFAEIAGTPLLTRKRDAAGAEARRAALEAAGVVAPPFYPGSGFAEDDLLDACAAAWTAVRCAAGTARSLPDPPERFSDGIPAAIWV
jgi:predicted RNase H-like nuclease